MKKERCLLQYHPHTIIVTFQNIKMSDTDNEIETLQTENQAMKQQISQNEEQITTLGQQLKRISLKIKTKQRIIQLQEELSRMEKEKDRLSDMIECQNCILNKQKSLLETENIIQTHKFIPFSPNTQTRPKSQKENAFLELQTEINNLSDKINDERISIHQKRRHIKSIRELVNNIDAMKKEIETKDTERDKIDARKANVQMLRIRIQDHLSLLSDTPEKIQTKFDLSKEFYLSKQRRNIQTIHQYQTILGELKDKI